LLIINDGSLFLKFAKFYSISAKSLKKMTGKTNKNPKMEVFRIPLVDLINMEHKLVLLSDRIDW